MTEHVQLKKCGSLSEMLAAERFQMQVQTIYRDCLGKFLWLQYKFHILPFGLLRPVLILAKCGQFLSSSDILVGGTFYRQVQI